jgi:RHS repeat-associated protein
LDSYIKLINLRSRLYSPETGRFLTRDSWQGDCNRPLCLNRWNYTEGNPVNFTDPSGYIKEGNQSQKADLIVEKLKQYNAHIEKDWGSQLIPSGYLYYSGCEWEEGLWTVDQLSTVLASFNKIRNRLNISEAKVAKILRATTFKRVDQIQNWFVDNAVADASPSGLVRLSADAFDTGALPEQWYGTYF